jgi:hypothetical protein
MINQLKDDLVKKWSLIALDKYNSIEELRDYVINFNPHSISLMPEKYFNKKWIPVILSSDGFLIKYIPSEYHTEEFCLRALQRGNPREVYCLFKNQHKIVSKALLKLSLHNFDIVNQKHLSSSMIIKAISMSEHWILSIEKIPNKRVLKFLVKKEWGEYYFKTVISNNIQFSDKDLLKILKKNHSPAIVKHISFNVDLALKTLDLNNFLFKHINLCQHTNSVEEAYAYLNEKKAIISLISA